jgi:hypothetical protein
MKIVIGPQSTPITTIDTRHPTSPTDIDMPAVRRQSRRLQGLQPEISIDHNIGRRQPRRAQAHEFYVERGGHAAGLTPDYMRRRIWYCPEPRSPDLSDVAKPPSIIRFSPGPNPPSPHLQPIQWVEHPPNPIHYPI